MQHWRFCGYYAWHASHSWGETDENGQVELHKCFGLPEGDWTPEGECKHKYSFAHVDLAEKTTIYVFTCDHCKAVHQITRETASLLKKLRRLPHRRNSGLLKA